MQVTAEGQRTRCAGLALIWLIIAALLYAHAAVFRDYIDRLDRMGLRGVSTAPTPLARVCPTPFADTQMWVRHALALSQGSGPQLRHTEVDNAPFGREVHWDSGFAWAIAGAGWLRRLATGESLPPAVEQSLAWFNFPLLLAVVVFFSWWVSRRAGLGGAVALAFLMVGHPDFYVGFAPNYVDHHGLLAAAVLGLVLGIVFMGVGFHHTGRPVSVAAGTSGGSPSSPTSGGAGLDNASLLPASYDVARSGAILSAVSGALGMWISAATLIPAIALTGVIAALATIALGHRASTGDICFSPRLWRTWGTIGAVVSFAFYLLEYAPGRLGFRLEVNHPVYALAWWGGAELMAQLGEWRCGIGGSPRFRSARRIAASLSLALAPAIIGLAGERVFVVFDPFVTRLSAYVLEGLSFVKTVQTLGWISMAVKLPSAIAMVALAVVLWWRTRSSERVVALFTMLMAAAFVAMAFAQGRWWPTASSAAIALMFLGLAAAVRDRSAVGRWLSIGALVVFVCAPVILGRTYAQVVANRRQLSDPSDVVQPLYRDIAAQLRASHPSGDIVLLASPNASAAISYYGEFKSIGTLYWENIAGTKAAAEMFSAQSETEARRLLRKRGVTHVAMISDTNFLAEYFSLWYPKPKDETLENSFGYELLVQQQVPLWLEQVPYEAPRDIPAGDMRVLLFATKFSGDRAESWYESAVAEVAAGRLATAEQKLDQALSLAPQSAEFWVIKAHLVFARGDVPGAFDAVRHAIDSASPVQVYPICTAEAPRFYQAHAYAAAVELYRVALKVQFDPTIANNLAWILATSPDDHVRNGHEALELVEPMARDRSDYLTLGGYAAALAECGRYREAADVAGRAVGAARTTNDASLVRKAEACRSAYTSGRPWRE